MHAWRPPRYALIAAAAALGVLIGLVAALLRSSHAPAAPPESMRAQVTWPPGTKRAPLFALRDQRGQVVSTASLRGRPVLVTFIYTKCPIATFCPLMDQHFAAIQKKLKDDPALRGRVHLVSVSFDPINDFAPIIHLASAPNVVLVHPSLPVKSIGDFVRLARQHPGALSYASSGNGSSSPRATSARPRSTGRMRTSRPRGPKRPHSSPTPAPPGRSPTTTSSRHPMAGWLPTCRWCWVTWPCPDGRC